MLARQPLAIALAALLSSAAPAATRTWDGGANTARWGAVAGGVSNWGLHASLGPVLADGDHLVFAGRQRLVNENDFSALSVSGLDFAPGAGAFVLRGQALGLKGSLRNFSGQRQQVSLEIRAQTDQTWDGGSGGLLLDAWRVDAGHVRLAGEIKFNAGWAPVIGVSGAAHLSVADGRQIRSQGINLGAAQGAVGALSLSGQRTEWIADGPLHAGLTGQGWLEVSDGASFSSRGALLGLGPNGRASEVRGLGSRWTVQGEPLQVGGEGRLRIAAGAQLATQGGNVSVSGAVTLLGADSQWRDTARVHLRGGELLVREGAGAHFEELTVESRGRLLMQDGGSRLDVRSMRLASGGSLQLDRSTQAQVAQLQGDAGSQLILRGGRLEVDALRLAAGSQLDWQGGTLALPALQLGGSDAPIGALLVLEDDSTLALQGELRVLGEGVLLMRAGARLQAQALVLEGGTVLRQGDASWQLAELAGQGLIAGGGEVQGRLDPSGSLQFGGGDLQLTAGSVLRLDLAGESFDRLGGIGRLQADGRIELHFAPGVAGNRQALRFDLLDFEQMAGSYRIEVLGLDASRVDLSRFAIDGSVGVSAVPEPSAWVLMAGGLGWLVCRRRAMR
ncbi:MAG: PEP-CTERM sorting domain-containing protein [Burkholderiales bacterium]|nr:PEP-CTERM sorting domain-containing protein [Burkholderiales bacterium]